MLILNTVVQIQHLSRKTPKAPQLILVDRKLKLHEITEELKISEGSVFTILHEHLSMAASLGVNTSFNKSRAWHIDGATKKKKSHDFYKVLTFKWHKSKFVPNWIINLEITDIFKGSYRCHYRTLA